MDITIVFGTVVVGSIPTGSTNKSLNHGVIASVVFLKIIKYLDCSILYILGMLNYHKILYRTRKNLIL